jgi:hypothetical protein
VFLEFVYTDDGCIQEQVDIGRLINDSPYTIHLKLKTLENTSGDSGAIIQNIGGGPCNDATSTITTITLCQAIAQSLGKDWNNVGGVSHAGPGCFYHQNYDTIGFNSD